MSKIITPDLCDEFPEVRLLDRDAIGQIKLPLLQAVQEE